MDSNIEKPATSNDPDDMLEPREAMAVLNSSRTTIFRLMDGGALPFYRFNSRVRRVRRADLDAFIAKSRVNRGSGA